jgi:catechol 2,3-dioxygenase-like lactoylglutathione lyase family enzyme
VILAFRHTGLVVSDLDAALRFYVDLLGFRVVKRELESGANLDKMLDLDDVRVTTVKLELPKGGMIELLRFESHPPCGQDWADKRISLAVIGFSHIALTVGDLDAEYYRLTCAGVEFLSAPVVSGSCKVAFCLDPEENYLELVEQLSFPRAA